MLGFVLGIIVALFAAAVAVFTYVRWSSKAKQIGADAAADISSVVGSPPTPVAPTVASPPTIVAPPPTTP